jgi:hypothetical protein
MAEQIGGNPSPAGSAPAVEPTPIPIPGEARAKRAVRNASSAREIERSKARTRSGSEKPAKRGKRGKRSAAPKRSEKRAGGGAEKQAAKQHSKTAKRPNGQQPKRAKKRPKDDGKLVAELTTQLEQLDASLNDMVDAYRLRIDAGILSLLKAARGDGLEGASARVRAARITPQAAQKMIQLIAGVSLKPRKGRVKDFDRLQDLVEELVELLPETNEKISAQ